MRRTIMVVSGLWLGVTFSGCLDLAGDWAEFEGPGWVSPSSKYYQDGALTLPMGECKEYHSEAECQMLSHWGPFGVVNSEFIPLCINNRRFSPGSKFFDGADEACLGLMLREGHTYADDYVVPGAAPIYSVLGNELEIVEIPDVIDGDLVVNVGPVHFAESWMPLIRPPVIRFWVDIVEGFEIPLEEAETYDIEFFGETFWRYNIRRVYIPKASLLAEVSFSLGDWKNLYSAWWENTIRISFVDSRPFQDWSDPVGSLFDDCGYNLDKENCGLTSELEEWTQWKSCDHDAPKVGKTMSEWVGTRVTVRGATSGRMPPFKS